MIVFVGAVETYSPVLFCPTKAPYLASNFFTLAPNSLGP